jgi:hypothetical protein
MWFRKRKLFEEKPETLSLETLMVLQASLIAKLIQTNNELMNRHERMAALQKGWKTKILLSLYSRWRPKRCVDSIIILNQVLTQKLKKS